MSYQKWSIGSDNILWLRNLKNRLTGDREPGADVQAIIRTTGGAEVAGVIWPVTLVHVDVGDDWNTSEDGPYAAGNYRAVGFSEAVMVEDETYMATVTVTVGGDVPRVFKKRIKAAYE